MAQHNVYFINNYTGSHQPLWLTNECIPVVRWSLSGETAKPLNELKLNTTYFS